MSLPISKFWVQEFRGLQDLTIEGLTRVNLLVGPNNSGKSSLLEALSFACDPINPEKFISLARGREVKSSREPLIDSLRGLFPCSGGSYGSEIRTYLTCSGDPNERYALATYSLKTEVGGSPDDPEIGEEPVDVMELMLHTSPMGSCPPDHPAKQEAIFKVRSRGRETFSPSQTRNMIPCIAISPVTHRAELFQITALSALDDPRMKGSIVDLLRGFDDGVKDIYIVDKTGVRSSLRVWHKRTGSTPLSLFGDGFRRVLTYALAIFQCRNGVLLIDEIETAIHFSALHKVYKWLVDSCEKLNVQLVATTHSLEALDAILAAHNTGPNIVEPEPENEFEPLELPPKGSANLSVYRLKREGRFVKVKRIAGESAWDIRYGGGLELR